ncbi:MAG: class I SAM-dependent methyltransferase [Candidatus Eremiobacterota bacterium]
MDDPLFNCVETFQGEDPWGHCLDAGTGWTSLDWMLGIKTESVTAVTADPEWARMLPEEYADRLRPQDRVIHGNWANRELLQGQMYDTVLADYLLGTVERWAPYFQAYLFERLKEITRSRLYVIGLEPYPDYPAARAEQMVNEIVRFRDACITLGGDRPQREFPLYWVIKHLEAAGFEVEYRIFPIVYQERFVEEELDVARAALRKVSSPLREALEAREVRIRARALDVLAELEGLRCSHDYVVHARRKDPPAG